MLEVWNGRDGLMEEIEQEVDFTAVQLGKYLVDVSEGVLKLNNINLTSVELNEIYGFLIETSIVCRLDLSDNRLNPKEINLIATILRDNQDIAELDLSECEIYSEGKGYSEAVNHLYDAIANHQCLCDINLAGNHLDANAKQKFEFLAGKVGIIIQLEWVSAPFISNDSAAQYAPVEDIINSNDRAISHYFEQEDFGMKF